MAPALALLLGEEMRDKTFLVFVQADETATDPERMVYFVKPCKAYFHAGFERRGLRQGNCDFGKDLAPAWNVACMDESTQTARGQVKGLSRCAVTFEAWHGDRYHQSTIQAQAEVLASLYADDAFRQADFVQGNTLVTAGLE